MTNNIDSTQNEDNTTTETITTETITTQEEVPVRKELGLTYISINFLNEVAKWAKFISIVGFVFVGFMVIVGISMGSFMNSFNDMMPEDSPAIMAYGGGLFGAIYIIMAAIYAIPVYYLYKFSSKLKTAIQQHNETTLEESLKNLKSHYKFLGISLILFLVLYGGIFIIFSASTLFL